MRSRFRVCRFARLKSNVFTLCFAEKTRLAHCGYCGFIAICTLLAALLGRQLFWLTLSPLIRAPRCTARNERLKHCKAKHLCKAFLPSFFLHIFLKALCLIDNAPEDGGAEACFAGCTRVSLINVPNESIKLRQGKSMKKHQTM